MNNKLKMSTFAIRFNKICEMTEQREPSLWKINKESETIEI